MSRHEHRAHKDYQSQPLPLDHGEELRRLLRAYEDCPGITADLLALIEDLDLFSEVRP
jgi:hypothetical protein